MRSLQCIANPEGERQGALEPTKKDLMNSKIISLSRAACLVELTSNPKSFFNCPDLHGGVPDRQRGTRCLEHAGKKMRLPFLSMAVRL